MGKPTPRGPQHRDHYATWLWNVGPLVLSRHVFLLLTHPCLMGPLAQKLRESRVEILDRLAVACTRVYLANSHPKKTFVDPQPGYFTAGLMSAVIILAVKRYYER